MKSFFIIGALLAICLAHSVYSQKNYCASPCGSSHVGCNATNQMSPSCSNDSSTYTLNAQEIALILDLHNDYRNAICNGSISGFAPCARVARLVWDDELAYLAGLTSHTCNFNYDQCRNTDKFKNVGQSLAGIGIGEQYNTYPNADDTIRSVVLTFYNENKYVNMTDMQSFSNRARMFSQLMWSNATAIGCGGSRFITNGNRFFEIVCDYSAGLTEGMPVYASSSKGGSGCTTGTDPKYPALCSDKEPLDPNYKTGANNSSGSNGSNGTNSSNDSDSSSGSSNFANKNYCTTNCGSSHVGCNATDKLSPSCSNDSSIYRFNAQDIQLFLDLQNNYRNAICNGSVSGFAPCARMAKMVWNDELAYLSGLTTRGCTISYDSCRNTDEFKAVGQNVAAVGTYGPYSDPTQAIRMAVDTFYGQNKDVNMTDINSYRNRGNLFTQLLWSNATAVGCGATRFVSNGIYWFDIVCDYSAGNIVGTPVYNTASSGGSGCATGTDPKYPALCSDKETWNSGSSNPATPTPGPTASSTTTPRPTAGSTVTPGPTAGSTVTPGPTAATTMTPRPTAESTATPRPTAASTVTPATPTSATSKPATANSTADYCKTSCGAKHIACNTTDKLSSNCPAESDIYRFTADDIALILDLHNSYRNTVCNGSVSGFDQCARMGKMTWDNELAFLGGLSSRKCGFPSDTCRVTDRFKNVGQNAQMSGALGSYNSPTDAIRAIMAMSYDQKKDINMDDIKSYNNRGGGFTQILWSNATAVGCGATRFTSSDGGKWFEVVCDYSTGNLGGQPVYLTSTKAGSGCQNGMDTKYPALCGDNESLDPNYEYGFTDQAPYTPPNKTKDFCKTSCGPNHVACNATDKLSSNCPAQADIYRFNADDIALILDLHNSYRNSVCNGSVSGFDQCARMGKMSWDHELAYLGGLTSRTCSFSTDPCRMTDRFENVGQSYQMAASTGSYSSPASAIRSVLAMFYDDRKNVNMDDIRSYNNRGGGFTQLVWSNATAVGCGATRFTDSNGNKWFEVVCDYSIGNIIGTPAYLSSTKAGSGCTTGTDTKYPALCSDKEQLDPNYIIGITDHAGAYTPNFPTDYCKTSCGTKHLGCNATDKLVPSCSADAKIYRFDPQQIAYILHLHNDFRNSICNGSVAPYEPCAQSAKMVWDEEMAYLAGLNTRTCEFGHDPCRGTNKFPGSGQNIGKVWGKQYPSAQTAIYGSIFGFYDEHRFANMTDINKMYRGYADDAHTIAIGHYTQLQWANATAVGCGATLSNHNGDRTFVVACNYATGNMMGRPVYLRSSKAGTSCKTGMDTTYKALCSPKENIDPNY